MLREQGARVIVVNNADALFEGLKGKPLWVAQAQLVHLSNTSGAKFVLVGGEVMVGGVRSNQQLAWRYDVVRHAEHVRYFA